jgi:hypothetical protein
VEVHGSKFEHCKFFAVSADPTLAEQKGPSGASFYCYSEHDHNGGGRGAKYKGAADIK